MKRYSFWEQDGTGAPIAKRQQRHKSLAAALRAAEQMLARSPAVEIWTDRCFMALVKRDPR